MESHNESSAQQLRQRAAGNQFKQPQSEFDFAGIHNTHESTKILVMCADTSGQERGILNALTRYSNVSTFQYVDFILKWEGI